MKLEYDGQKIGCGEWLLLLIIVGSIFFSVVISTKCYLQPTISEAPGYCLMILK